MYHHIDLQLPSDGSRELTVSPRTFAWQLQYLQNNGFRVISMGELARSLQQRLSLRKTVVMTFDDGYADQGEYAVPLLHRMRDGATFFIVTGTVGTPGHLTWEMLRRMVRSGLDIGAHGVSHDDLSIMSDAEQQRQIFGSVALLRRRLHAPVLSYAYPSGRLNGETLRLVRRAEVPLAVTTDPRYVLYAQTRWELTRLRVKGSWRQHDFADALRHALAHPRRVLL